MQCGLTIAIFMVTVKLITPQQFEQIQCPRSLCRAPFNIIADDCGRTVRMIERTYAKIVAKKRREFIERMLRRLRRVDGNKSSIDISLRIHRAVCLRFCALIDADQTFGTHRSMRETGD
jgi:hypothetical protein